MNGDLTNDPLGLVFNSGNDAYGGETGLTMTAGTTFDNAGTLDMLYSAGMDLRDGGITFNNTGVMEAGLGANTLGPTIYANASPDDTMGLGGTINPVLAGGYIPQFQSVPPGDPIPPIDYDMVHANFSNPNGLDLSCGAGIGGGFGMSCSSTSAAAAVLVDAATNTDDPTTTTVVSSSPLAPYGNGTAPTSNFGQSVTFTATVTPAGSPSPTGTVTFFDGVTVLGTAPLSTAGGITSASVTAPLLTTGAHPVMALYSGDATSIMSSSFQITQVVDANTTTVSVTSAPASAGLGHPLTLSAKMVPSLAAGQAPTGEVLFYDGGVFLGAAKVSTAAGVTRATIASAALLTGPNSITAAYTGDVDYTGSFSTAITATVATPVAPAALKIKGPSKVTAGKQYKANASATGTALQFFALATSPATHKRLAISPAGAVTFTVPKKGLSSFSYVVVVMNAAGRLEGGLVKVTVKKA